MRRTLWSGLAAVVITSLVAVLGLGPGASATPPPKPSATEFFVAIVADLAPPTDGQSFSFSAALDSQGTAVPGVPVTLMGRPYGASDFAPIGHGTTDANGSVSISVVLRRTLAVRWTYAGNDQYAATTSQRFVQQVATRVRAHARNDVVDRGDRVVVAGRTGVHKAGMRVVLWRGQIPYPLSPGPGPKKYGAGVVAADGTFRLTTRFGLRGPKKMFVSVNPGHGNTTGYSDYVRIRVR